MKQIPETDNALVLRTDFSDDSLWGSLRAAIQKPVGVFRAYVDFLSDPEYNGITTEQILSFIPADSNHSFLFIVDRITLAHPEHPVLVLSLYPERGRTFRVVPREMWGVENNLSIANMDFEDFADAVDPDGVFRGFRQM
jgi:hypothetical protein